LEQPYAIEMLNITKRFPGIVANDNITLQLKRGEIHALLGENGAGKSTLMSVLFGLYQPEEGVIKKDGQVVQIKDPNDANALGIGMVHQHFKLVECFSILDNIILGVEPCKNGFLQKQEAREKVLALSEKYGLQVDPDALVEDVTVGMQQRTEILKMLYRDNEILIFDEPTAVLTPQEIDELMQIMKNLAAEGKSILFISHKLNEIMSVADRCTVLRKGKYIGTVNIAETSREELSRMMVGRDVEFAVHKEPSKPKDPILVVEGMTVASKLHNNNAVKNISFTVRAGEIVCIAGIDGNGQTELIYGLTGLECAEMILEQGHSLAMVEMNPTVGQGIFGVVFNDIYSRIKPYDPEVYTSHRLTAVTDTGVTVEDMATGETKTIAADTVVLAMGTHSQEAMEASYRAAGLNAILVGSAEMPGRIAGATRDGFEKAWGFEAE